MSGELRALIIPEAHYTLFNAEREGLPEVIVVNDALLSFPHNDIFPWHLRISINAYDLAKNGMPTPEESAVLFEVGDELEKNVLAGLTANGARNSLFLARSTWNTYREIYFMVHDPENTHQAILSLLVSRQWTRQWEYSMSEDRAWEKAGYIFQLFARKLLDFPVGDRLISRVGYHRKGVTGGAEGDDSYASFFLVASLRALTPR
jgi:hypothetical protein